MLLKIGSRGDDVKKLQEKLGLSADGAFGPGTEKAVKKWQINNTLTPDGLVGEGTWNKMFGPQQLIEVKEPTTDTSNREDEITQAVQILSNLASLKLKVQESRTEALEIRQAIDILFSDKSVTEEEITHLKEGFKVLKNFAQANLRYQEAKLKAEQARQILDQALKSPE